MSELFDAAFYASLQRFTLAVHSKMNAGMGGGRKSNAKGTSVEFADFREYQLGDDIRRIDWNAYGRMNKLFVKLFMEEKEGRFHILTDCSASMDYGETGKFTRARQIAAMLSYMVLRNLDRVILTELREEGVRRSSSMTGRQSFQKILTMLEQYETAGRVDLYQAVQRIPFHGRGVTFLLSDFMDQPYMEELCRYLLYQKQEVVFIQVLAKEELFPELEGDYKLLGVEDGKEVRISFSGSVVKHYQEVLEKRKRQLAGLAAHYQITFLSVSTGEDLEQVLAKGVQGGQILQK